MAHRLCRIKNLEYLLKNIYRYILGKKSTNRDNGNIKNFIVIILSYLLIKLHPLFNKNGKKQQSYRWKFRINSNILSRLKLTNCMRMISFIFKELT